MDGPSGKATATTAAAGTEDGAARVPVGLGRPGRTLNHRSPFLIGMKAVAGVAVTYGLVELLIKARPVLILIELAFFIAAGLDPVVVHLDNS